MVEQLEETYPSERILVGGFSQGGECLSHVRFAITVWLACTWSDKCLPCLLDNVQLHLLWEVSCSTPVSLLEPSYLVVGPFSAMTLLQHKSTKRTSRCVPIL